MLERPDTYENPKVLPDHAKDIDSRGIAIERVGIKGLTYPIRVMDKTNKMQATVAEIDAYVGLEENVRGTHMSRFVEIINGERTEITLRSLPSLLRAIQRKLESPSAHLRVRFPYFIEKSAPVSNASSFMDYPCEFVASLVDDSFQFTLVVTVPVTSLCPCSKAVSDYGAHNQRSHIRVQVQSQGFVWIEDVIDAVEQSASAPLYALLKRSDEKWVTEQAYDNPKFVEDLVRDCLLAVQSLPGVNDVRVMAENFESIHNHSAFAELHWNSDESSYAENVSKEPLPVDRHQGFGAWLKAVRIARELPQQVLADRLGTSASFLSRVESNNKRLSPALLTQLAAILGMDPITVQLRAGVVPDNLLKRIAHDPESFLYWAQQANPS